MMTAEALAQQLGISGKTLRAWLRKTYPEHRRYGRWILDKYQVAEATLHFGLR